MATQRTLTEIYALLADNVSGNISPEDMRDSIASVFSNFGALFLADGSTAQTGLSNIPNKLVAPSGWTDNFAVGCIMDDSVNSKLSVTVDGIYLVIFGASFEGVNNGLYNIAINAGSPTTYISSQKMMKRKISTGADVGDGNGFGFAALNAGDDIELWVNCPNGDTSITLVHAGLVAIKVG